MIQNLLINAFDILVAGLLVVFLFLILLTALTSGLVSLFPEKQTANASAQNKKRAESPVPAQSTSLTSAQHAAIAAAVHGYRRQH